MAELAALGSREAWALVIEALADDEPEVADRAQLELAGVDDPRVLRDLLGRAGLAAREDWVRWRVAEALGRLRVSVDARDLVDALPARDPEGLRLGLWSVERLAGAGRLLEPARAVERVDRLGRASRDAGVRAGSLHALVALGAPQVRERVEQDLGDRRATVRAAAVAAAWRLDDRAWAHARTRSAVDDPDSAVRGQVLAGWARWGTRAAAAALVERLSAEDRPRLRSAIVEALRALSGLRHRADPRPWRHWLERLPEDWCASPASGPPGGVAARGADRAAPGGEHTVSFAGLPLRSDRVVFLVDLSGSLWREREDGTTKKQVADGHLRRTLDALAEDAAFNLVPYTGQPLPWEDGLVPARRSHRRRALDWFERRRETGRGNFWDAALCALEDPDVDTLVTLTDGAPTGGPHWDLELMFPLLLERTRFRAVAFDSILVDAPPRLQRHWEALAAASGGRSIAVEWD